MCPRFSIVLILRLYRGNVRLMFPLVFMARSSRNFAWRWAFGPNGLKNSQIVVTMTTVAMATKKRSHGPHILWNGIKFDLREHRDLCQKYLMGPVSMVTIMLPWQPKNCVLNVFFFFIQAVFTTRKPGRTVQERVREHLGLLVSMATIPLWWQPKNIISKVGFVNLMINDSLFDPLGGY